MKRLLLFLIAALVLVPAALAVNPPSRSVLVSLSSVDGNKVGGSPAGFTTTVKATFDAGNSYNQIDLQWERKKGDPSTEWATQTRDNEGKNYSIAYFASFHTTKVDRSGVTTYAEFMKHWPGGKLMTASPLVGSYKSWNVVYRTKQVKTIVMFDKNKRLAGIALYGTWGPPNSMEQYCTLPQCAGHS